MPRYTYIQNSFITGEISPKLKARTDIKEYANGVEEMQNMLPYKSGGATRRPGMRIARSLSIADTQTYTPTDRTSADNLNENVIFPFDLGEGRRFKIILHINSVKGDFSVVDQNEDLVPEIGAGPVADGTIEYMKSLITIQPSSELQKGLSPTGFHYAQIDNALFITHNSGVMRPLYVVMEKDPVIYPTKKGIFTLESLGNYTVTQYVPNLPSSKFNTFSMSEIPMLSSNTSNVTLQVTAGVIALGNTVTITATNPSGNFAMWTDDDIGSTLLLDDKTVPASGSTYAGFTITAMNGGGPDSYHSVDATVEIRTAAPYTNPNTDYWYESAWSDSKGWPRTVAAFESRIFFGGTKSFPDSVWASQINLPTALNSYIQFVTAISGQYQREVDLFDLPLQAQPYNFTISSANSSAITWMASTNALFIGTTTAEFVATGGQDSIMTPLLGAIQIKPQSFHGGSPYMPAGSNNRVYYISRDAKSVMEIGFSEQNGSFVSRNMSVLSDELIHNGNTDRDARIQKIAWNESRGVLWALTNTKKLFGLSIDLTAGVTAWHKHPTDDLSIYDIISFYNEDNTYDNTYLLSHHADQTTEGVLLLVKMVDDFEHSDLFNSSTREEDKPVFLDLGGYFDNGSPGTTFNLQTLINVDDNAFDDKIVTGDLDGLTYTVINDSENIESSITVASDQITVSESTTEFICGYVYTSKIKTLPIEVGPNAILNSQGDIQRYDRATILLYKSRTGKYGTDDTLYDIEEGSIAEPFTGKFKIELPQSPGNDNHVTIQTSDGLPMSVLGIIIRGVNNS